MFSEGKKKFLTPLQAFERMKKYCAYQERSHSEVRTQLLEHGLRGNDLENILVKLIEENFLNEERFSNAFAGGKFRMKSWGKKKIEQHLKAKGVSSYNIKQSIKDIDENAYKIAMMKLLEKKAATLKDTNLFTRKQKLSSYLISKGYESAIVYAAVKKFFEK